MAGVRSGRQKKGRLVNPDRRGNAGKDEEDGLDGRRERRLARSDKSVENRRGGRRDRRDGEKGVKGKSESAGKRLSDVDDGERIAVRRNGACLIALDNDYDFSSLEDCGHSCKLTFSRT